MLLNKAGRLESSSQTTADIRPISSVWFDWAMAVLSGWYVGGLFLDGWAHNHDRVDSTFFTPWHGAFYSGFLVVALLIDLAMVRNILRGSSWMRAAPAGYELAAFGVPLFAFGGVFDLIWHQLFGFEVGIEPLLSPSHLLLATSMGLIVSAPLRAAWLREDSAPRGVIGWLPALLSLAFTLSVITFLTQFGHPFVSVWASTMRGDDMGHAIGVLSVMLQASLLIGAALLMLRRWMLPPGSLTLLLGLNTLLMVTQRDQYRLLPVALLGGVVADLLIAVLRPSAERPLALRLFAFAAPAALYLCYFLAIKFDGRMLWSTNLWSGAVVLAGIVGLLLSYLVAPARGRTS